MGEAEHTSTASKAVIAIDPLVKELDRVVSKLTPQNREAMLRACYDTAKLVYYKQERTGKPQLKLKEIGWCLETIHFHHRRDKVVVVNGQLADNFGGKFPVDRALDYYEHNLEGTYKDQFGNVITVDEPGLSFLYEGHDLTGDYLEPRAKRLPWIKHTLTTSLEVYEGEEQGHQQFYYVTHYAIPLVSPEPTQHCYFIVIVRKRKDRSLGFLTAFYVDTYNRFLSKIAKWRPVNQTLQLPC